MAGPNTPERRGGRTSWAAWIVVLLIVGVVVWLIAAYAGRDRRPDVAEAPPAVPGAPANGVWRTDEAPITSLGQLTVPDARQLEGRDVNLTQVPVTSVVANEGFFIGTADQSVFVRHEDAPVQAGQRVNIRGEVQQLPDDPQDRWNIPADQVTAMRTTGVYIDANEVHIAGAAANGAGRY